MTTESVIWPCARVPDTDRFFAALEAAVKESDAWTFRPYTDAPVILAMYRGSEFEGEDLRMCVFEGDARTQVVDFAPTAAVWAGKPANETHVTDKQINKAFGLFAPVVRHAAKAIGLDIKVILARPRVFRLSKKMREKVDSFVHLANWEILHPCDWERFYGLIHQSHKCYIDMKPEDLAKELATRGVPLGQIKELAEMYEFGRQLLAQNFCWTERMNRIRRRSDVIPE
jgi:hypothetical protein